MRSKFVFPIIITEQSNDERRKKENIEQMSERLFHYLRKRESSASQEAEDEVWSKISEQIDKKKHIPRLSLAYTGDSCCCCFSPVCILAE